MTIDFASVIEDITGNGEVTGASFAYWDGERLHEAVGGLRNSVTGDPVTLDTLMHIGSITKVLNATLFMQLVDDGLIDLDDPVTKHLPELQLGDPEALAKITCRMLINHTNGIDYDVPEYRDFDEQRIENAIEDCAARPQIHPPGEATAYSNIGTVIAGYIAQKLRREGWYSLIKSRIFEPLGLRHSLADITELPRFRVSVGDQVDGEGKLVQSSKPFLPLSFAAAGATVMMTAADLVAFARALINGGVGVNGVRILSKASALLMATETARFASPATWRVGLGWLLLPGGVLSHGGGGPGVNSILYAHPESGRTFALLTNCSRHGPFDAPLIEPLLASWGAAVEPLAPVDGAFDAAAYEGSFQNQIYRFDVFREGGRLSARMVARFAVYETDSARAPIYQLERVGDHLFRMSLNGEANAFPLAFVDPDANGKMQRMGSMARIFNRIP
ncbi:CubicO group peptidase (beta-lactamase class C family) [Sphingopyxis panaciterrae]|uniref:serine hydrolase domain-containing protein n=1 Tax=Sphingopyxis panaciterrae TaxID=363841 RepID=UPI00141DA82E|nr:serine hydrolase domain-containing protein [Sphingopyxis panaciterrae]NIJ39378.1 CubicO group peptidase (beta-lactamase class C family) [Sphingopyxis panaciterrae]